MVTSASGGTAAVQSSRGIGAAVPRGAFAGIAASLVMAMFAMIAALTYQGTGFFTPLYHIAASVAPGDAMMQSMQGAMAGNSFTFLFGPAVLGAIVHMTVGAGFGALFAVTAHLLGWRGVTLVGAGLAWGLAVFAISTWIGLPLAASLFGGGDPIRSMASMVGFPTFVLEHLLYGITLGLLVAGASRNRR